MDALSQFLHSLANWCISGQLEFSHVCTFAFARQEHSPPTAFHLSGLPQLRFVDTVASQLEEKPGAKNWPGGKKGQNWGKMEKSVGLRGQILRVASSWARKGAKLSTLRLFLFPVVVNCTRCVITVIAARQRERSWHQQMFSPSLNFQMATKALLKSGAATLWKREISLNRHSRFEVGV